MNQWMIYGVNGYTGKLIAKEAKKRGMTPVLAGRNAGEIAALSRELEMPSRVFDLDDNSLLKEQLSDIFLVLNCAGPFSATSRPMLEACLETQTHYLDITGEIDVFEYAHSLDERAKTAGITVCPGVGFDVVPTDCLAAALKQTLPSASHLRLGFDSDSRLSAGTMKTAVEGLASGGRIRENGQIIQVPLAYKTMEIDFGRGSKQAMTFPWGDVSTAFFTTGIPNIEVYIPASPKRIASLKKLNRIRWFLGLKWIQNFLKKKAGQQAGPTASQLETQYSYLWGEVADEQGNQISARLKVANGYALTVRSSLAMVEYMLSKDVSAGYFTPSQLMGADFISSLEGSSDIVFGDIYP